MIFKHKNEEYKLDIKTDNVDISQSQARIASTNNLKDLFKWDYLPGPNINKVIITKKEEDPNPNTKQLYYCFNKYQLKNNNNTLLFIKEDIKKDFVKPMFNCELMYLPVISGLSIKDNKRQITILLDLYKHIKLSEDLKNIIEMIETIIDFLVFEN